MPELPEVETVRAGLERSVLGRTITAVDISHPRSVRRHVAGSADLAARLVGAQLIFARRRGKYLWLPLARGHRPTGEALVAHLGMSGQFLVRPPGVPDEKHLHVRISLQGNARGTGSELRFIDQRTFGGLLIDQLVSNGSADGSPDGSADSVPAQIVHIARDPLDPRFDDAGFVSALRRRESAVKRALLDQTLVSGIGNIYADEALWRARLHGQRLGRSLTRAAALGLLAEVRSVLNEALAAGGTSFDALYVNVNGQGGYFERSLAVYGRENQPCPRCGAGIRRAPFMNRSSFYCPACQRPPARRTRP